MFYGWEEREWEPGHTFDWGDFHKIAVIFFSFFGPLLILGIIFAALYFACLKSWYEKFKEDVHETHRSYHPWPPGSAKWQLQQYLNSAKGLPSKLQPTTPQPPQSYSTLPTAEAVVQSHRVQQQQQPSAALAAPLQITYPASCLPSPQTTYTVAVDPDIQKQVPYTTVIKPKGPKVIETIFSAEGPQIAYPPSFTAPPPMSAQYRIQSPVPISVITDPALYPRQPSDTRGAYQQPHSLHTVPIERNLTGGSLLYSQGHDWSQVGPRPAFSYIEGLSPGVRDAGAPSPSARPSSHPDYRVQSPSSRYAGSTLSPGTQMQAIIVRTTTTTHRKTTLSPTPFTSV